MIHAIARRVVAPILLLGMLGLAACSLNPVQPHTLTAADILSHASSVLNLDGKTQGTSAETVKDLTFTMNIDINMDMQNAYLGAQKLTENMSATGEETLKPRRSQMNATMSLTGLSKSQTPSTNFSMTTIVDYASGMGYLKSSEFDGVPGFSSGKWYEVSYGSLSSYGADTSLYLDYSKLKNAKLIGSEVINGVAVWHLRAKEDVNSGSVPQPTGGAASGNASSNGNFTATVDYYFRKDNYRPVKVVMVGGENSSFGKIGMNAEMNFTAFNTGVSITLPAASDVQPLKL